MDSPASWQASELEADPGWRFILDARARRDLTAAGGGAGRAGEPG